MSEIGEPCGYCGTPDDGETWCCRLRYEKDYQRWFDRVKELLNGPGWDAAPAPGARDEENTDG